MPVIVQLITRGERGGAQVHVVELLKQAHARAGFHVVCGETGFLSDACAELGVPFHHVPELARAISPLRDLRACTSVAAILDRIRPDVLHAHTAKAGALGRVLGAMKRIPVVYTPHGFAFTERHAGLTRGLAWMAESALSFAPADIVAVSRNEADRAIRSLRVTVIPNGIQDYAIPVGNRGAGPPAIAMVARFADPKDHALLLRACAGIERPFRLALIGDGPLVARTRALAGELGLSSKVDFLGERSDVVALLPSFSIAALASRSESQPLCLVEAMRAGLPVVASAVGGVPEMVEDGVTGWLAPRGDAGGFAARLTALLDNADARQRMGQAGRARYESSFRAETMAVRLLSLYGTVIEA